MFKNLISWARIYGMENINIRTFIDGMPVQREKQTTVTKKQIKIDAVAFNQGDDDTDDGFLIQSLVHQLIANYVYTAKLEIKDIKTGTVYVSCLGELVSYNLSSKEHEPVECSVIFKIIEK